MGLKIVKAWSFKSGTSDKMYQTLRYADGSVSCDCMGWTRRCKAGRRSCKHTRWVDMRMADRMCESNIKYGGEPEAATFATARHFDFS